VDSAGAPVTADGSRSPPGRSRGRYASTSIAKARFRCAGVAPGLYDLRFDQPGQRSLFLLFEVELGRHGDEDLGRIEVCALGRLDLFLDCDDPRSSRISRSCWKVDTSR
jgi:hypothetical protein